MRTALSEKEIEQEIARLKNNPDVQLARAANRLKQRRRQDLYNLRYLAKYGAELREAGYTCENIRKMSDELTGDITENCNNHRDIELPEWGISLPPKKE